METEKNSRESFRVPNSIIQGLTTNTTTGLNRLTAFQMVTLLGLLTRVSSKDPEAEVRTTVSEILEIVEVSKQVALAVERHWQTADGEVRRKKYRSCRYSPHHLQMIHEALLVLHGKTVLVRQRDPANRNKLTERLVHILDSFGYVHERGGRLLDPDDLHCGEKVNVGTEDRPVWRIRVQAATGMRFNRPTGIVYRLNKELADELCKKKGSICYTLMARKVFTIFKRFMKSPPILRLIFLILRQTGDSFYRRLKRVLYDLGFEPTHPTRALHQLREALAVLRELQIVETFTIDEVGDGLEVWVNRQWHKRAGEKEETGDGSF